MNFTKRLIAREICEEFGLNLMGNSDKEILSPSSIKKHSNQTLCWAKDIESIEQIKSGCVIVSANLNYIKNSSVTYLTTLKKPRLIFTQILIKYINFDFKPSNNFVHIFKQNENLHIGDNCHIDKNVEIGDGTIIFNNTVILGPTSIGKNCVIQPNVTIGTVGIAIEMDENKKEYIKFPQLGGVIIADNVDIGAHSNIQRGALDDTVIGKGSKLGPYVNIGHNTIIGSNCMITAKVNTSGTSEVGDGVILGVGCSLKNGIRVNNNAVIGQGAVVTNNVPEGKTYVGIPAKDIDEQNAFEKLKIKLFHYFKSTT